jgi:multiphosphoryl transfer protein
MMWIIKRLTRGNRMQQTKRLALLAPLSGRLLALGEVPDPVFAQKLMGEGVSIDPETSCLRAPCDARVQHVHSAGHAVSLLVEEGVEVVIHVGLETVQLKGEGFQPRVRAGDEVRCGDPLIEFAPDYVATHARSLLTQMVVPSADRVRSVRPRRGHVAAGRDVVLEIELSEAASPAASPAAGEGTRRTSSPVHVSLASGLHARPAAVVAGVAKRYRSSVRMRRGADAANAKSVTALLGLEVQGGDAVSLEAEGPDADEAISALVALLASGLSEDGDGTLAAPPVAPAPRREEDPNVIWGVPASPGVTIGQVFQLRRWEPALDRDEPGAGPALERPRLDHALAQGRLQLEALQGRLRDAADHGKAAVFAAHAELLDDPELLERARAEIDAGASAARAWHMAVEAEARHLSASGNERVAARAADLRDVGRRVLHLLAGRVPAAVAYPEQAVLVAEDLSPSETAELDRSRVQGFCTVSGGATSHVAILARGLGLPAVVATEAWALEVPDGTPVVLDGTRGTLRLRPSAEEVERVRVHQDQLAARKREDREHARAVAVTRDGATIAVKANVGGLAEAREAAALGADGIGLLRSEFLFLDRATAPSEDEQYEAYRAFVGAQEPGRPLVIRLLDVGGDKPLAYLPLPREDNPFLGLRGVRLLLERPDAARAQMRAILRASAGAAVSVMVPMVATLEEWRAVKALFEHERVRLGVAPVPLGIMVEVPSAALLADAFAREADFLSIGTNDLTQYTLAMDRGHPQLAPAVDSLHPAVLQLVAQSARAALRHGRGLSVCGGMASEEQALPILLGLGVAELSVSVPMIPALKARIRELDLEGCRALAERALACATAGEVRALQAMEER